MIDVQGLARRFGELWAVAGVDFRVEAGEVFGFLGPNGAGKTTTIKMLCTLLRPSRGAARVAGYDVVRQSKAVRQSIGIIFQDPSLDDRLTAYENLRFHGMIYRVPRSELNGRIDRVLEMVELADRRSSLVRYFSGGMKRRLEIARGLLHAPKVLFLDEPTLGLDPQTRAHIWQYLHGLRAERDITLFLTTHYMDEAENCDRIAIVDRGKLIALDRPAELKRMVKGDVISLQTTDNRKAAEELKELFSVQVSFDGDGLQLEIERGEEILPELVRRLSVSVLSAGIHHPTLDDVFLKLTGRAIRDETASEKDRLRGFMRAHRRLR